MSHKLLTSIDWIQFLRLGAIHNKCQPLGVTLGVLKKLIFYNYGSMGAGGMCKADAVFSIF